MVCASNVRESKVYKGKYTFEFMFGGDINFLRIILTSVILFIIGFYWYGPLFGKHWIKLSKISASDLSKAKQKSRTKPAIFNFIGNIVMVCVLANFINLLGIASIAQGIILGFWVWLGFFAATTLLGSVLWDNKPWGLFVLNGLYWLVQLMVAGAILAV